MKNTQPENKIRIAHQGELCYPIPRIPDHKEYAEYQALIKRIDEILKITALDLDFAESYVTEFISRTKAAEPKPPSTKQIQRVANTAIQAYRCTMVGMLLGRSFREQSVCLAESFLLQQFCGIARIDGELRVPTKSFLTPVV